MAKALALTSGGLDSILAAKLIAEQGIEVLCVCFESAFFGSANAVRMTKQLDLPLKIVDFTEEHLEMVKCPKHGYGKNMNPCIDCHAMMMRYAGRMLEEEQADFIISGEVLDQRPMSQNRKSLETVKKESGFEDKILRPLSAKNLPPTQMELDGLVDRERLLDFHGKNRKPQMALAKEWGIVDYPTPAGGCLLTEEQFSMKLEDLLNHSPQADAEDVRLLRIGRHFRLGPSLKAVSSRTKEEYEALMKSVKPNDWVLHTADFGGSTVVLIPEEGYEVTEEDLQLAGGIAGRYCKGRTESQVRVKYQRKSPALAGECWAEPRTDDALKPLLIC